MIILLLKVWSKEILAPCGHHLCSYQLPISVYGVLGLCTKYDNLLLTSDIGKCDDEYGILNLKRSTLVNRVRKGKNSL